MQFSIHQQGLVKYHPTAVGQPEVTPLVNSLVKFHLRCLTSGITPIINEGTFQNLRELKLFGRMVYSQLPSTDQKTTFFDLYQKGKKEMLSYNQRRRILSAWCRHGKMIAIDSKNYTAFLNFANYFQIDYSATSAWHQNAVKLKGDPNFGLVCMLGHMQAMQTLFHQNPQLAAQSLTFKGASALDCAILGQHLELVRFLYQQGGRPKQVKPYSYTVRSGNWKLVELMMKGCPEIRVNVEEEKELVPLSALSGKREIMSFFLRQGLSIDEVTESQNDTALHLACQHHLNDVVAFLLEHNAQVTIKNRSGQSPLEVALKAKNVDAIKMLVAKHKKELLRDESYLCLFFACERGDLELVTLLMDDSIARDLKDAKGRPILHLASSSGKKELVEYLLQLKFAPQQKDRRGGSALHVAVGENFPEIAALLLDAKEEVNEEDHAGFVPLVYARTQEMIEFLMRRGANQNHQRTTDGFTGLMIGLFNGVREEIVLEWLGRGSDCKLVAKNRLSPLAVALALGYHKAAQEMIDRGGEVTLNRESLSIALNIAIQRGNFEGAQQLLERGADANYVYQEACPVILVMRQPNKSEEEKIAILELLRAKGANLNVSLPGGVPGPVLLLLATSANLSKVANYLLNQGIKIQEDTACQSLVNALVGNVGLARELLKQGALVEPITRTESSPTPLQMALACGHTDVALELINLGANIDAIVAGLSVLAWACLKGNVKVVETLIGRGVKMTSIPQGVTPLHAVLRNPEQLLREYANVQPVLKRSFSKILIRQICKKQSKRLLSCY